MSITQPWEALQSISPSVLRISLYQYKIKCTMFFYVLSGLSTDKASAAVKPVCRILWTQVWRLQPTDHPSLIHPIIPMISQKASTF